MSTGLYSASSKLPSSNYEKRLTTIKENEVGDYTLSELLKPIATTNCIFELSIIHKITFKYQMKWDVLILLDKIHVFCLKTVQM